MPVAVVCPSCKAKLKAPDTLIGKTVKCPGCATPVLVKALAAPGSTPAPPVKKVVKQPPPPVLDEEPIDDVDPVEEEVEPAVRPKKKRRGDEEVGDGEEVGRPPAGGPSTDKERGTAMWIHLLPVVLSCCGGIGTFISLFLWISKRKESLFIDHHGKTWLNWVINLFAAGFILGIVSGVLQAIGGLSGSGTVALIVSALVGLLVFAFFVGVLVMQIMVAMKAKKGEWAEYRVLFKVLK